MNFSKFYDDFSLRNNVKEKLLPVACCLNERDLSNLLKIKHSNLEG